MHTLVTAPAVAARVTNRVTDPNRAMADSGLSSSFRKFFAEDFCKSHLSAV